MWFIHHICRMRHLKISSKDWLWCIYCTYWAWEDQCYIRRKLTQSSLSAFYWERREKWERCIAADRSVFQSWRRYHILFRKTHRRKPALLNNITNSSDGALLIQTSTSPDCSSSATQSAGYFLKCYLSSTSTASPSTCVSSKVQTTGDRQVSWSWYFRKAFKRLNPQWLCLKRDALTKTTDQ